MFNSIRLCPGPSGVNQPAKMGGMDILCFSSKGEGCYSPVAPRFTLVQAGPRLNDCEQVPILTENFFLIFRFEYI